LPRTSLAQLTADSHSAIGLRVKCQPLYSDANVYSESRFGPVELCGLHSAFSTASREAERGSAKIGTYRIFAYHSHASTFTRPVPHVNGSTFPSASCRSGCLHSRATGGSGAGFSRVAAEVPLADAPAVTTARSATATSSPTQAIRRTKAWWHTASGNTRLVRVVARACWQHSRQRAPARRFPSRKTPARRREEHRRARWPTPAASQDDHQDPGSTPGEYLDVRPIAPPPQTRLDSVPGVDKVDPHRYDASCPGV
jgi:hypothetical protein